MSIFLSLYCSPRVGCTTHEGMSSYEYRMIHNQQKPDFQRPKRKRKTCCNCSNSNQTGIMKAHEMSFISLILFYWVDHSEEKNNNNNNSASTNL